MTFKNAGSAPSITPKVFENTFIFGQDLTNAQNDLKTLLTSYKNAEHSGYDYKVKTAVNFAGKNAINVTIDGFTKRKVAGNDVYYLNDYEVDSDLKNSGMYKTAGLKDAHGARVKLSSNEVHDLKKKLLGGYDDVSTVSHDDIDNYYLLDILEQLSGNVSFIQKLMDEDNGTLTYAVGTNTAGAVNVLKYFNNSLRINPLGECSADVKAFGSFSDSSVTVSSFKLNFVFKSGALTGINLEMNGTASISFPQSEEFTSAKEAEFKLTLKMETNDKAADYEPAATVNKVK
ncbi:MAG: hypothetical protein J6023_07015 [Clostridia bacterium]|nr:hypothetical protein [Clostridia bacterium]